MILRKHPNQVKYYQDLLPADQKGYKLLNQKLENILKDIGI